VYASCFRPDWMPACPDGMPATAGARRRHDLRGTLGRICPARERQVDAVTVAGDLYKNRYALPDTGEAAQPSWIGPHTVFIA
jgi:hypothetical protein